MAVHRADVLRDGRALWLAGALLATAIVLLAVGSWIPGVVLLVVASTLLIANTIRLSIFARRREIEVMKLVGATDWFIRWPFVLEGVMVGFIGGTLAVLLLGVLKVAVIDPLADDFALIEDRLNHFVDDGCDLIFTTGGTGLTPDDVTPEATLAVADKVMPGFGEQMRQISLQFVPTAILSRQVAVIRGQALIINLPGQPKSIKETLEGLKDPSGKSLVHGILAAVPYCVDLIGGPYIETREDVVKAFRPKSAQRPRSAAG